MLAEKNTNHAINPMTPAEEAAYRPVLHAYLAAAFPANGKPAHPSAVAAAKAAFWKSGKLKVKAHA